MIKLYCDKCGLEIHDDERCGIVISKACIANISQKNIHFENCDNSMNRYQFLCPLCFKENNDFIDKDPKIINY